MTAQTWMTIGLWLLAITGLLSLPMAMMSPMMFDSPEAAGNTATNFLFYSVLTFPIAAGISVCFAGMIAQNWGVVPGLITRWIPLLNVVVLIAAIFYIDKFQGGSFGG